MKASRFRLPKWLAVLCLSFMAGTAPDAAAQVTGTVAVVSNILPDLSDEVLAALKLATR